jgi:hypothetical protein
MKNSNQFKKVTEGKRIGRVVWVTVYVSEDGSHIAIGAPTKEKLSKAWSELKLPFSINMDHVKKARFFNDNNRKAKAK